jgi:hypothetical protein
MPPRGTRSMVRPICPICNKPVRRQLWAHLQRCHKKHSPKSTKPNKFRNREVEVNGVHFQSAKEAARSYELDQWQLQGRITDLERQVTFDLVVTGRLICQYIADFVYLAPVDPFSGLSRVVEDVKSTATRKLRAYRIKKKLMKAIHNIDILET